VAANFRSSSKGMAEGGCGGNSAIPLQKIEASPAALLVESRTQQKSFLFLLEEKIRRAQIRKSEENFFAGWRVVASGGGLASLVPFKVGSSKVQNIPPDSTSNFFRGGCLAALRLGLVALRLAQSHIIPRLGKRKGSGLYI
ncbi:MAG: hypothetical protein Q8Q94_01020, partial [bacterium]|nr:hypothetical protein [bacterium]